MFFQRFWVSSAFLLLACSDPGAGAGPDAGGWNGADAGAMGDGGGPAPESAIFAHSSSQLFKIDPNTLETTLIGQLTGCSGLIDLAVDKNSRIIGSTSSTLYEIDGNTAACTPINAEPGLYPNSLSFVPVGILDPTKEVLVGFAGNRTFQRFDPETGAKMDIGQVAGGYSSSGDVVSVQGLGTFLTANHSSCPTDCLIEIDPTTGEFLKSWGDLGHNSVWGLAYWGGIAYGFTASGTMFSIAFNSGATDTVTTTDIDIPDAPAGLSFYGAGSTTIAPIVIQ